MSLTIPPPPKITRELAVRLATDKWRDECGDDPMPEVYVLAVRGYRASSMGPTPQNDPGIWDDLLALVSPRKFLPVNANLDPSRYGWNQGVGKPYGLLQPGVWWFYPGPHKGRMPAFRQADDAATGRRLGFPKDGKFFVERCWGRGDKRNFFEWGYQQVDIHPGGYNTTSSWLCLTLPPTYADSWLQAAINELHSSGQRHLPVCLIDGPVN